MAELIAVNMKEKTGYENFKATRRGSQEFFFSSLSVLGCEQ